MPIKAVLRKNTFVPKEGKCYHFRVEGIPHLIYVDSVVNNEIKGSYVIPKRRSMHTCAYVQIDRYEDVRLCTASEQRDMLASVIANMYVQVTDEVIDNFQIF